MQGRPSVTPSPWMARDRGQGETPDARNGRGVSVHYAGALHISYDGCSRPRARQEQAPSGVARLYESWSSQGGYMCPGSGGPGP